MVEMHTLSSCAHAEDFDVVVIGGGQAGLAVGYYLRRTGLSRAAIATGSRSQGARHRGVSDTS
jgi:cation diffusion facilitator CzcD-associated flavoprotein CzcO